MSELKNQENKFSKFKDSFSSRKFRSGAFVSLVSLLVIVIVVIVNLIVSDLDLKVDFSLHDLYTLTSQTEELLDDLEEDVTIYYLIESGHEAPMFQEIAERFDNYSSRITLEHKDPVLYPQFAHQYVDSDTEVNKNSFLVVNNNNNRAKYVDNSELMVQELDYETFSFYTVGIDMEGKIASAIQYVTDPDLPTIYKTTGHNEAEVGPLFIDYLDKQNITLTDLETLRSDSIPEDCDVLFINAPATDFTDDETEMIMDYMAAGGNALIVVDFAAQNLNNFLSIIEYYGLKYNEGVVVEGNTNMHAPNMPHFIIPEVQEHEITDNMVNNQRFTLMAFATGLTEVDTMRSSLEIIPLLNTSEDSYSKAGESPEVWDKEEGDIDGPFYTGVIASDTFQGETSNMAVFTSRTMFDDETLQYYGNEDIFVGTLGFLTDKTSTFNIPSKSILPEFVYVTQQQAIFWGAMAIIVLPVIILGIGAYVGIRRRRR